MQKYSKESLVGIFVLVGLLCIGYMTVKLGDVGLFEDDRVEIGQHCQYARIGGRAGR
jgi:phospholipid/cholesterol/gamma-HCH transport system substrate-binding protein